MAAEKLLKIDPRDNVLVALAPLAAGEPVFFNGESYLPLSDVPAKHKFAMVDLPLGAHVIMYGGVVGRVREAIPRGGLLTTRNVQHDATDFARRESHLAWTPPDVARWQARTFNGFHRPDGQVGTRNYWLVIPLVFCENRNVEALREAFEEVWRPGEEAGRTACPGCGDTHPAGSSQIENLPQRRWHSLPDA
jgi:altronate hydrolase